MVGDKELDTGFRCWSCNEFTTLRARIAELEARIVWLECEAQVNAAPVSEAKAQGVVMPERWNVPRPMWKDARQPYGNPLNHADIEAAEKFNLALDEVARLNVAPVQQVSVPGGWRVERGYSPSGYVFHSPSGSMIRVCDSGGGGIETAFALFLKAMLAALQPSQGKAP